MSNHTWAPRSAANFSTGRRRPAAWATPSARVRGPNSEARAVGLMLTLTRGRAPMSSFSCTAAAGHDLVRSSRVRTSSSTRAA
jgi:hypothetical protein